MCVCVGKHCRVWCVCVGGVAVLQGLVVLVVVCVGVVVVVVVFKHCRVW